MAAGKVEGNWEIIFFDFISNDLFQCLTKRTVCVFDISKATDQKTFQLTELTGAFKVQHHPVNMIKVFPDIFYKQNFTIRVNLRNGTSKMSQHSQVSPNNLSSSFTKSVVWALSDVIP